MKPTIALFLYDPKCSVQSGNGIIRALQSDYNFKIFSINELEDNFFDNVDMIAVPGGFGDANSFDRAFKHNGDRIKDFVRNGGKYLGICMGAYWAGQHYFDILDSVDAVQYLSRPNTDTRRPHAKNISITWQGTSTNMFWYDGCALVGDTTKFKTISTYANGDPMAIIQDNIGLIGAHPESDQFWYDSYTWMKGKYHNGQHHTLLLEFVNKLMEEPMTDNTIKTLQTSLAQDLIKFEHKANHDALSEENLKLISETYQKVYQTLHEITVTDIK